MVEPRMAANALACQRPSMTTEETRLQQEEADECLSLTEHHREERVVSVPNPSPFTYAFIATCYQARRHDQLPGPMHTIPVCFIYIAQLCSYLLVFTDMPYFTSFIINRAQNHNIAIQEKSTDIKNTAHYFVNLQQPTANCHQPLCAFCRSLHALMPKVYTHSGQSELRHSGRVS